MKKVSKKLYSATVVSEALCLNILPKNYPHNLHRSRIRSNAGKIVLRNVNVNFWSLSRVLTFFVHTPPNYEPRLTPGSLWNEET